MTQIFPTGKRDTTVWILRFVMSTLSLTLCMHFLDHVVRWANLVMWIMKTEAPSAPTQSVDIVADHVFGPNDAHYGTGPYPLCGESCQRMDNILPLR